MMENEKYTCKTARAFLPTLALTGGLMMAASAAHAAPPVDASDMTINGTALANLLDSNGQVPINNGKQKFRYTGYGQSCSNAEWFIKLEGATEWHNFDHSKYAERMLHRAGTHQLKLTVDGYNNWFTFCFHKGEYSENIVELKIDTPSYAQTKYPIMVVPGVLAYDSINAIIDRIDYFYEFSEVIEAESDQLVHTFSLDPWQETTARGKDLAAKILERIAIADSTRPDHDVDLNKYPVAFDKVNLLAHSHGSTTSRVAIRELKEQGLDAVASLTTVAGPHFGTPTADGAKHGLDTWASGPLLQETLIPIFEVIGCTLATLAGDSHYCDKGIQATGLMDVLIDFTQTSMYKFNTETYPSYGVPSGGKYYLDSIPAAEQVDNFYEGYGRGLYDNWYAQTVKQYEVVQADGTVETLDMIIGNGYGQEAHINDPAAVQYYSFTGDAPSNSLPKPFPLSDGTILDNVLCMGDEISMDVMMDSVLCVFNSFYGAMYWNHMNTPEESDFPAGSPEWIPHDGFIPVDSAKFGVYLGKHYWNHVDEQNQFVGMVPSKDPDGVLVAKPNTIYRLHANRLQKAGL